MIKKQWLFFLLVFNQHVFSQSFKNYAWQTLDCKGEPVARHEAAFVNVDGQFYLLGGRRVQEVSIFNPENNTWTSGAKPPIELHHFQGVAYQHKIYVVGAHTGKYPHETPLPNAYVYDPVKDTWAKGFSLPKDRLRASTTANIYKDKLYIAGGIIDGHWDGHVKWFDVYDFETKTWEKLPDAPRARDHATSVICNDKLYLLGGRRSSGKIKKVFHLTVAEIDVYDFKTKTWSTLNSPIPSERAGCTSICVNDQIIFTGGETANHKAAYGEMDVLNTKTGKWSKLPSLVQGRHGTQLVLHNRKLYIASGCKQRGGSTELTSIECFGSKDGNDKVLNNTPVWKGKGRIAISSDGNEHDHDDWAATPLSLALLATANLQDRLTLYTYSDHIWGSNQHHPTSALGLTAYEQMRESALEGQKWFGFDKTKFICAVDNAEVAYQHLTQEINKSTADNPLIIIAAGPMQVVGEAINRADVAKLPYVTLISHSGWNDNHSDKPHKPFWDKHTGWTFKEIQQNFSKKEGGGLNTIKIKSQNGGKDYDGLKAPKEKFDWMKSSDFKNDERYKVGAIDWLYARMETCVKKGDFDASDAGMVLYLLTGIEKSSPEVLERFMKNPVVITQESTNNLLYRK